MERHTRGSVEGSRAARADTELSDALHCGFLDGLVPGEPKIVVGRQVQALVAVNCHKFTGLRAEKKERKKTTRLIVVKILAFVATNLFIDDWYVQRRMVGVHVGNERLGLPLSQQFLLLLFAQPLCLELLLPGRDSADEEPDHPAEQKGLQDQVVRRNLVKNGSARHG